MAQIITIDDKEIQAQQFRNDWALALMSRGVIVRLSIRRWGATSKLTPELLGLRFSGEDTFKFFCQYLNLGKQKLLPPPILQEIMTLEQKARVLLDHYSFDTVWGKFVPFTAFDEWEKANNKIHDDFLAQALELGKQYHSIVQSVKEDYKKMAQDVWIRLYPEDKGGPTSAFIEDFASKIIQKIPSQEELVSSFKYYSTYFIIPMPSFIEENLAKIGQIQRQEEIEKFNLELEKQTKKKIANEYVERKKELIDGFLESTVISMRKYVEELCDNVMYSLMKKPHKSIGTRHINRLKNMIRKVKVLNFYDDKEISLLLNGLDTELDKIKGETDRGVIIDKLKEIVEVTKQEYLPKNFNPAISVLEP